MRSPRAYPDPQELNEATRDAVRSAMRKAANELMQRVKDTPAPCGCRPKVRCDKHCRVKIRQRIDEGGRAWIAECDGSGPGDRIFGHGDTRVWCLSLPALHKIAAEHVIKHRSAALDRAHNEGTRANG